MSTDAVTPDELRAAFDVAGVDDGPTYTGLADLVRLALGRWGPTRKGRLTRYVRELLEYGGWEGELIKARLREVVDQLLLTGDVVEVYLSAIPQRGDESASPPGVLDEGEEAVAGAGVIQQEWSEGAYLAPGQLRLVTFGERWRLLLGCHAARLTVKPWWKKGGDSLGATARWLDTRDEALLTGVERLGVVELTPEEWLGPPEWRDIEANLCSMRSLDSDDIVPPPVCDISKLWELAASQLRRDSAVDVARWRILQGKAGDFFGWVGRTSSRFVALGEALDGTWLATRRGHQDTHLHPCMVRIEEAELVASRDLFNWNEWTWLLQARGEAVGLPEWPTEKGDRLKLISPVPTQLRRIGALCVREGWTWHPPDGLGDALFKLVRGC